MTDPRSNGVGFTSYFATLDQGSVALLLSYRPTLKSHLFRVSTWGDDYDTPQI